MDWSEVLRVGHRVLNYELFEISGTPVTLMSIIVFAVIVAISWLISRALCRTIERAFAARGVDDPGTTAITLRLTDYLVMGVGVAWGLNNIGVNLGALFAAGAVFAVGIGFAMQNIVQNFVSGLILILERAIKPGDVLEVEGRVVRVVRMGIRTTVARTRDEEELIIPNSTLVQSTVKNYTLQDSLYRIRASVGVEYGSDMGQVREVLAQAAGGVEWRAALRDPLVFLKEFGNSAVLWEVSVWVEDPWGAQRSQSDLNDAIWWALRDSGITIAFPQVDVHFDPPVEESLQRLPRAS